MPPIHNIVKGGFGRFFIFSSSHFGFASSTSAAFLMHLVSLLVVGIAGKAPLVPDAIEGSIQALSAKAACANAVSETTDINQAEKLAPYTRSTL